MHRVEHDLFRSGGHLEMLLKLCRCQVVLIHEQGFITMEKKTFCSNLQNDINLRWKLHWSGWPPVVVIMQYLCLNGPITSEIGRRLILRHGGRSHLVSKRLWMWKFKAVTRTHCLVFDSNEQSGNQIELYPVVYTALRFRSCKKAKLLQGHLAVALS